LPPLTTRYLQRIDTYIFSEFVLPFLSAGGIIAGVWLGIDRFKQIFKLLASSDYPWYTGFFILALDIPKIALNILPICILLACFLSFQKLSIQAEFTAMKAAGASYLRILKPVLFFGLIGILSCFILAEILIPITAPLNDNIFKSIKKRESREVKNFTYTKHYPNKEVQQIFYTKSIKEDQLNNLVIVDFDNNGFIEIHLAKNAEWNSKKHGWNLEKGNSSFIDRAAMDENEAFNHMVSNFKTKFIESPTNPLELIHIYKKIQSLNIFEIQKLIQLHEKNHLETSGLNSLKTSFQQRFAYPFTALILAFIGALLGFSSRRESRNWNYITLGLIVFSFFMFQAIFTSFGDSGRMSAIIAMWFPNFLLSLVAAVIFYFKTAK
jgi:lipopolysaccharide export system permease protein